MKSISAGVTLRFIFALALVLCTYNPSGHSYYHWLFANLKSITPYIAIAGIALLIGWAIYLNATLRALGPLGLILAAALLACFVWLLVYWGVLTLDKFEALAWVSEVLLAGLLAIGMSWSHIRRSMSGQIDVDDIDDDN